MLVEVKDLAVEFAAPGGILYAVRGVDLTLDRGELLGIVGESGSGKSVTAHTMLRLVPGNGTVKSGRILYKGKTDVLACGRDELRRYRGGGAGIIFQEPGLSFDPIYTVGKAFTETVRAHNPEISDAEAMEKALAILREVRVPSPEKRLENYPHQFSGGLLQRIMIALALVLSPDFLIADEPTTALDVTIQAQIVELLLQLKETRNLAVMFISHNLALISGIADRIAVMYSGLVMETGPASEVIERPRHPYTRALLDSVLNLGDHHTGKKARIMKGSVPNPMFPEPGCPYAPRCPMAVPECEKEIPPLVVEKTSYRCLFKGVKKEDTVRAAADNPARERERGRNA